MAPNRFTRKNRTTKRKAKKTFFGKKKTSTALVARKPSKRASLYNTILSIMNRHLQTKYVSQPLQTPDYNGVTGSQLYNFTAFSSGITGTNEIYACIPQTVQGLDDNNRIGDELSPIKCSVKLDLSWKDQENQQSFDRTVHIFMLQAKAVQDLANFSAIPITELLALGNGINGSFDGTKQRSQQPINRAAYTILHHKQIRLYKAWGRPNGVTGTSITGTDSLITSLSTSYRRVVLNVKLPQKFHYDTKSATYPENSAPFLVIGWTSNDAVGPADTAINLQVMGTTHMYYKDA